MRRHTPLLLRQRTGLCICYRKILTLPASAEPITQAACWFYKNGFRNASMHLSLCLCLLDTWTRSRGREDYRKGHAVLVDSFGPSRQPWAVLATPSTILLGTAKNSTCPFLRRPPSVLDLWKPELLDWAGVTGFHAARVWNIHVTRGLKRERHRSVVSYCMILCLLGEVLQD